MIRAIGLGDFLFFVLNETRFLLYTLRCHTKGNNKSEESVFFLKQ